MPNTDPHMQVARKIRTVETAKIELVQQLSEVFRGVQTANERDIAEALGGLVGIAYYLGQQLGVDLYTIDKHARTGLPRTLAQESLHSADYEHVQRYLDSSR